MIDLSLLRERFGIPCPRPYQELVIDHILSRRAGKILAILPTSSGKSLCFMYPLAATGEKALLLYPLKALMHDQKRRMDKAGIKSVVLEGGLGREERRKRLDAASKPGVSIITNMEMLLFLVDGPWKRLVENIPVMVIDEAHTIVTWGESFRSSFLELPRILEAMSPRLLLAFTATADKKTCEGMTRLIFNGEEPCVVRASSDRENIFYHSVHSLSKKADLRKILEPSSSRPALVFCRSRKETEELSAAFSGVMEIKCYHARLPSDEKKEKEEWFLRSREGVLAATTAYGMGVDKKDIRTVIHTSLPDSALAFLQEAGRGGRDGERMDSYVLWQDSEESPLSPVFKGKACIRSSLLGLMDEEMEDDKCLACSSCQEDGYIPAGMAEIARYLSWHPLRRRQKLPQALFSCLSSWSIEELRKAVCEMENYGFIRVSGQWCFFRKKICYNFLNNKGANRC